MEENRDKLPTVAAEINFFFFFFFFYLFISEYKHYLHHNKTEIHLNTLLTRQNNITF